MRRVDELGMELTPADYDLIKDIIASAEDTRMDAEMKYAHDNASAAAVLRKYGYYHITEEFLNVIVQYTMLLDQSGVFTEEEYREMERADFTERVSENINQLCAIGVIAALKYGVHTSFELPYLTAIADGSALIRKRYE